jgi:CheY-like chemotaxis protein
MSQVRNILLADDDPNDVHIVKAAFDRAGYAFPFHVVPNGEEAIAYLKGEGKYANRKKFPIPSLLLLDIKMPSIDGFEVLRWVRSRPEWRVLPVIVLTNSYYGPDVNRAYDLGANSFLTKPGDFNQYVGAVKQVAHFWLVQNVIPEVGPFVIVPHEKGNPASASPDPRVEVRKLVRLQGRPSFQPPNLEPPANPEITK